MRSWVIGSRADCDVVVDSPLVSARHCQLTQVADGFLLNDLGSTNGTYVNGVRIASARPRHARRLDHAGPDGADALAAGSGDVHPDRPPG